jgi:hypothetical protein
MLLGLKLESIVANTFFVRETARTAGYPNPRLSLRSRSS